MRLAFLVRPALPDLQRDLVGHAGEVAAQLRRMGHRCVVVGPSQDPAEDVRAVQHLLEQDPPAALHVFGGLDVPQVFELSRGRGVPAIEHVSGVAALFGIGRYGSSGCSRPGGCECAGAPARGLQALAEQGGILDVADALATPSRALAEHFAAEGFDSGAWHHVPLGIDYARHPGRRPPPGDGGLHVGLAPPLVPGGGAHLLLEAIRRLPTRQLRVSLMVEGPAGCGYAAEVLRLAAKDPRVAPGTVRREGPQAPAGVDAIAIPSLLFPMTSARAVSALASGVPVIGPDVPGMREMVRAYRCGLTFAPEDADALAGLLERLLDEPGLLQEVRRDMVPPPGVEEEAWCLERLTEAQAGEHPEVRPRTARRTGPVKARLLGGSVDVPRDGSLVPRALTVLYGWALCEPGPANAVEVSLNGVSLGLARVGLPRPDVAERFSHPDGAVAGYAFQLDLSGLPEDVTQALIEVTLHAPGGQRLPLRPITVHLQERPGPDAETERRAADLRERCRRVIGHLPARPADGVRLLAFTHDLGYAGGQLYLWEMLRLLAPEPWFSCTVVSPADGPLRKDLEAAGIPVHVTSGYPIHDVELYEGKLIELGAWARRHEFNVVLGNTVLAFPGIDLAERMGLPGVWAIHESYELPVFWSVFCPPEKPIHPLVADRVPAALASAAAVVFEADATRRMYERYGDPMRFVKLAYGIDLRTIDDYRSRLNREQTRRRLGIPGSAVALLCLGTIEVRKAQIMIAQALRRVAGSHHDAFCIFVGDGGGEYAEALRRYTASPDLADRTMVVPVTPDVYEWYGAADVFVCASDVESLPRSVLEAMAFELPVAATKVYGLGELIEDGRTGYLCEPRKLDALTELIDRILSLSPADRRRVARAGARLVRDRHDSRGYAEAYGRLLRALVADPEVYPGDVLDGTRLQEASSGSLTEAGS